VESADGGLFEEVEELLVFGHAVIDLIEPLADAVTGFFFRDAGRFSGAFGFVFQGFGGDEGEEVPDFLDHFATQGVLGSHEAFDAGFEFVELVSAFGGRAGDD